MSAPNNRLGVLLMSLTALIFALQDGISRLLIEDHSIFQIVMVRYWIMAAFVILMAQRHGGVRAVAQTQLPWLQWARGAIMALEICVTVGAIGLIGLTETHAVFICYPLLIVALSGPLLGEQVGWRRWAAIGAGFVGVLIILQPSQGVFSPYALIPLAGAILFAAYAIMTRYAARYDSAETSRFYTGIGGCVVMSLIGPFFWQPIWGASLLWLMLLCGLSLVGHSLLIKTYDVAEASAVQPFSYLQLPFAAAVGIIAFSETLRMNVALGATIIVGAGLFTLWREQRDHQDASRTAKP